MSAELRVLWATIVIAALLTGLAWWLAQRRPVRAPVESHDDTTETAPWLVWSTPPTTSRDVSVSVDASTSGDAGANTEAPRTEGPSTEARDRLGALLAAAFCARREECLCGAYPSPYAEGHETATTCEADVLRDLHREWEEQVTTPVVLLDDEALHAAIDRSIRCTGTETMLDDFVRADAVDGERCDSEWRCRDGSRCDEGLCVALSRLGERCTDIGGEWDVRILDCEHGLRCIGGRCEERLGPGEPCNDERIDCRDDHACVEGSCVRLRVEGEACTPRDRCAYSLECIESRCSRPSWHTLPLECDPPMLGRFVGRHRPYDRGPLECIPFGTPCRYGSDCGWGWCEGAGARRCDAPGPHAALTHRERRAGARACAPGASCGGYGNNCECAAGSTCREDHGVLRCLPDLGRGEPCQHAGCVEGLECDHQVPEGGRCVARICWETRFFD